MNTGLRLRFGSSKTQVDVAAPDGLQREVGETCLNNPSGPDPFLGSLHSTHPTKNRPI